MLDDDLTFSKRYHDGKKWKKKKFDDIDWSEFLNTIELYMDAGFSFGGISPSWIPPSHNYWPYRYNAKIMGATFMDCKNLAKYNPDWTRLDVNLQLLTQGLKTILLTSFVFDTTPTNTKGGCSTYRDIELQNRNILKYQSIWPEYVKAEENVVNKGPWKGQTGLKAITYTAKAYKNWVKNNE